MTSDKFINGENANKAVLYCRFSSENQREESIEGQRRECLEYAKKNGIEVIAEYVDRAKSATTDNRTDFQRMMRESASRSFGIVLVWKFDRFARSKYDSLKYKAILKRNGVICNLIFTIFSVLIFTSVSYPLFSFLLLINP